MLLHVIGFRSLMWRVWFKMKMLDMCRVWRNWRRSMWRGNGGEETICTCSM
jgi:hypothetical protein